MVTGRGLRDTDPHRLALRIVTRRPPLTERLAATATCVAILTATACSSPAPTGIVCTALYAYGISLTVQNAATRARITDSAAVRIRDGSYVESYNYLGPAGQPTSGVVFAAGERAGIYSISIRKTGFAPYDTAGIKVTKDACHVHGVGVTANLQPNG